jgi:hypothetical protein
MPGKATRAGPAKAPRHQNTFAFRHNANSVKSIRIAALPNTNCCIRCTEIIEWRKKYRKYKPIKDLRKCYSCNQKAVKFAYHVLCCSCCKQQSKCAKCTQLLSVANAAAAEQGNVPQEEEEEPITLDALQLLMSQQGTRERVRRTVIRLYERGDATNDQLKQLITNGASGAQDDDLLLNLLSMCCDAINCHRNRIVRLDCLLRISI